MSQLLTTLLICVLIAVVSIVSVYLLAFVARKHTKMIPVIESIANALPDVLGLTEKLTASESKPVGKIFETLQKVAEASAQSVEQICSSGSGDLTGQEKMELAKNTFQSIAKSVGIDPSDLDNKVIEALIESVVYHFNK